MRIDHDWEDGPYGAKLTWAEGDDGFALCSFMWPMESWGFVCRGGAEAWLEEDTLVMWLERWPQDLTIEVSLGAETVHAETVRLAYEEGCGGESVAVVGVGY